ncbi:MAG: hypothetical protein WDO71_19030 [Bacteroidota bacterium]
MKKLLSTFCCILYIHSIAQSPADIKVISSKTTGEKVLIKALAVIVNPEGNKKPPARKINLSSNECP